MHKRRIVVFAAVVSVAACSDATLTSPDDDGIRAGPSLAIVDAGNGGEVDGFWFLPPLAKQVTTEGFLDEGLQPAMRVCELTGNPSAIAPGGDPSVVCVDQDGDPATDDPKIVTYFPPGSAGTAPGSHYEFSWDTDASPANLQPMDAERFYRIQILLEDVLLGYLDVNPQEPSGQLPGEDYADLYAFRLGETLPVKVFLTTQVRCALAAQEEYVVQCTAQGVVDDDGGVVTLEPIPDWPATISVVVPAEALPPGYPTVILTLERIDPVAFEATTGEACIPGLPGLSSFDAPLFGDCLRVTSDPVLPMELEAAALIEICVDLSSPSFSTVKLTEGQEDRLQIIRYADDGTTHGLPNVQTTTCPAPAQPSPAQLGFFPVPESDGLFRTAAVAANTVARWLAPEPLGAHGSINLGGATTSFSRFEWGLPGQMIPELGDGAVVQQPESGPTDYDVTVQVRVVDAGTADPGLVLPPSNVEGATVHFGGDGTVAPTDVTTGSDGIAEVTWTLPGSPGTYELEARALGLLATPVPDHQDLVEFTESTVTFTATLVGPPAAATQVPDPGRIIEGQPGEALIQPFLVTVVDANGKPVVGYTVDWQSVCGAGPALCGSVQGDPVTSQDGQATGYWTLASVAGPNTLEVTIGGLTLSWSAIVGCQVTVDGDRSTVPGEWDCAGATATRAFMANISGGETPAEVRWQTDGENLYFLVLVEQGTLDKVNSLRIDFDNTLDGPTPDDDAIGFDADGGGTTGTFLDEYLTERCVNRSQSGCGSADTSGGGTVDGEGALGSDGTYTVYELSHPLNSGDLRDFALGSGDQAGFYLTLRIGNGAQGNTQAPGFRKYWTVTLD